jgi:hypothetical protein
MVNVPCIKSVALKCGAWARLMKNGWLHARLIRVLISAAAQIVAAACNAYTRACQS